VKLREHEVVPRLVFPKRYNASKHLAQVLLLSDDLQRVGVGDGRYIANSSGLDIEHVLVGYPFELLGIGPGCLDIVDTRDAHGCRSDLWADWWPAETKRELFAVGCVAKACQLLAGLFVTDGAARWIGPVDLEYVAVNERSSQEIACCPRNVKNLGEMEASVVATASALGSSLGGKRDGADTLNTQAVCENRRPRGVVIPKPEPVLCDAWQVQQPVERRLDQ